MRRYRVNVTWTLEDSYEVEAESDYEAERKAKQWFETDFTDLPLWAGDSPHAEVYDYEEIEDDDD